MSPLTKGLVAAAVLWPLVLTAALWQRSLGHGTFWLAVYLAASEICHQRPERSFHLAAVPWPVCARCLGLYMAAPIGALLAVMTRRTRPLDLRRWLAIAGLPTATSLVLEWAGFVPVTNAMRCLAALPLGAMIAFAITRVSDRRVSAIG
jgi:uncharacterized membrane protein